LLAASTWGKFAVTRKVSPMVVLAMVTVHLGRPGGTLTVSRGTCRSA
jgi:hypothetical protein